MIQIEGKQRGVGWVLGKYAHHDLRYVYLEDHDLTVIQSDARIAELTAEVARYKADAERLDWCEANADHGSIPYYEDGKFNVTWLSRRAEGVCTSQFNSLREAIDFARNALKDGV